MDPTALTPFPTNNIHRALCVVAHPDDLEYGVSAAVSHWVSQGIEVSYLLLTHGEAGMQRHPDEVGPLRAEEQRRACAAVGVTQLTMLNHPDGMLMPTLDLRRDIAREIRRVRPEVVLTMAWDVIVPWGLNQADHRAAGLATLDAVRDADNTWVFPELAEAEHLPKWGATWFLVAGSATPTHGIEVSADDVTAAVTSLSEHQAYLADLPDHPAPADFLPSSLAAQGELLGVPSAFCVQAFHLH
ncbi:MAG: PIG-L deacetylase family protein [Propioniciclava sp.]